MGAVFTSYRNIDGAHMGIDERRAGMWTWAGRLVVAAFVIALGWWACGTGMRVRERAFDCSRTIRFHNDIANAMRWGNRVLRVAEAMAGGRVPPDPLTADGIAPERGPGNRLTFFEIVRGEGRTYADLVDGQPGGDFDLDYPPLRLLTMTLWTRAVQDRYPGLTRWPAGPDRRSSPNPIPQSRAATLATEDIAEPLLRMNAAAGGATALLSFALVWLWVDRGNRRGTVPKGRRRPTAGPATPLRRANGLVLFPIAVMPLAYGLSVAVLPMNAPAPAVSWAGPPAVYAVGPNRAARVSGSVDPQGADTRWHVEWGTTAGVFDHNSNEQSAGGGSGMTNVSAELTDLPPGATVHYRLVARNDGARRDEVGRGTTRSDEATLIATPGTIQPSPPSGVVGAAWLDRWAWAGLAVVFALTCGALRVLPPEHRGWAAGTVAGLLVWFDPTLLVNAHVWPQWDVYLLPPLLLAALLASLDWWLAAGLVMGVGCMFKGQFLIGSPVLLLWPLLSLRWGAAGRLAIGFILSAGVLMSPWLLLAGRSPADNPEPLRWVAAVAIAGVVGAVLSLYRGPASRVAARYWLWARPQVRPAVRRVLRRPVLVDGTEVTPPPAVSLVGVGSFAAAVLAAIVVDTLLVVDRWPADAELPRGSWAGLALLTVLVPPWVLRRRSLVPWGAAVLAMSVWGGAYLYHGDWSWKAVGFEYGTRKHDHLEISHGAGSNMGTVLQRDFGWETHDEMLSFRPPDVAGMLYAGRPGPVPHWLRSWHLDGSAMTLDVRETLLAVYGLVMLVAGIGAAVQDRRNDPRFLAALIAPWMLMPSLLAQMMDRYEVWGAVLSSMLIAASSGLGVVHIAVTLAAAGMIGGQLLGTDPSRSPAVQKLVTALGPHEAGLLIAAGLAVLFTGVVPGRRRPPIEPIPSSPSPLLPSALLITAAEEREIHTELQPLSL